MAIGIKQTVKIITKYPAIFLTPVFSYWTIGPVKSVSTVTSPKKCFSFKRQYLGVSYWHTWINTLITMICTITGFFFYSPDGYNDYIDYNLTIKITLLLLGALPILILQFKKCFCCNCCCNLPTNMTVLDVYHTEKLIPLEQINVDQNTVEMDVSQSNM